MLGRVQRGDLGSAAPIGLWSKPFPRLLRGDRPKIHNPKPENPNPPYNLLGEKETGSISDKRRLGSGGVPGF